MGERNSIRLKVAKARVGSKGLAWALALAIVAAALGLTRPLETLAGPNPPSITPSGVYFTGDQSQGINCDKDKPFNIWNLDQGQKRIFIENLTKDIAPASGPGVYMRGRGGDGSNGSGGSNGDNGAGGPVGINLRFLQNNYSIKPGGQGEGILAASEGGNGGSGGNSGGLWANGGTGGNGGAAGYVHVGIQRIAGTDPAISTQGAAAILARSQGGAGGEGGDARSATSSRAGSGGNGGAGSGARIVNSWASLKTTGDSAPGIVAASIGGNGGKGGYAGWVASSEGGRGGKGGDALYVAMWLRGATISTSGTASFGIWAVSQGGRGGDGGSADGARGVGGNGGGEAGPDGL